MMENDASIIKRSIVGIGSVCVQIGNAEMISYAIGSCIALCLYDSVSKIGAMAHILLPSGSYTGHENTEIDVNTKYADHALACALQKMCELGADRHKIKAAIIGGAMMFPHGNTKSLNIGEMNIASISTELQKNNIPLVYSVTGGKKSRTVSYKIPCNGFDECITVRSPHT